MTAEIALASLHPPRPYSTRLYMTAEIALTSLHPPRPYGTRSHMHTGPLVITTATPSLWLIPP
jgi:hypothetical protein